MILHELLQSSQFQKLPILVLLPPYVAEPFFLKNIATEFQFNVPLQVCMEVKCGFLFERSLHKNYFFPIPIDIKMC